LFSLEVEAETLNIGWYFEKLYKTDFLR